LAGLFVIGHDRETTLKTLKQALEIAVNPRSLKIALR